VSDASQQSRIHPALLSVVVVLVGVAILLVGGLHYRSEEQRIFKGRAQELMSVGLLKAGQIAEWRNERLSDAIRFAQGPTLVRALAANNRSELRAMLVLNRKGNFYEDALWVSPDGELLLSATDTPSPVAPETQRAVKAALSRQTPTLSDFYQNEKGVTHIDVAAPIKNEQGTKVAALVLRCSTATFLDPLIRSWPVASESAETLLVRRDGDEAVFLNQVRHLHDATRMLRLPLTQTRRPAVQAILGKQGSVHGLDYRDAKVLADVRPIPGSDWLIVTKIDYAEILADVRSRAFAISCFAFLAILLTAFVTAFGYRSQQAKLYRALYSAEQEQHAFAEKFRTILYSIGDAVISTDEKSCVLQMNPVAEHLTGWTENEALGKPIDQIFNIVNEETRSPVENPATQVLREGKVVGLANHTVLIARDGTERPISDSGAPVCGRAGEILGVVLVFRDQSAEHAAQKALCASEAQYRDLFQNMTEGFALHEIICDGQGKPVDYRFVKVNAAFERLTGLSAERIIGHRVREVLPDTEPCWIETYGAVALDGKATRFENYSASLKRHYRITAFCPRPGQFCTLFDDISEQKKAEAARAKLEEQLHQSQKLEAIGQLAGGIAHDFNNMLAVIIGNAELALEGLSNAGPFYAELNEITKAGKHSAELVKQLLAFASRQTIVPQVLNLNAALADRLPMLRRIVSEELVFEWHPGADLWNIRFDPNQLEQVLINLTVNARDAISGVGQISIATCNVTETGKDDDPGYDLPAGDYVELTIEDTGCGMDAATQAHIFEPFFTTKPNSLGTGLGLPTVYGIIKQNHGAIRVASTPGKGSRFSLYLPRYVAPATAAPSVPVTTTENNAVSPAALSPACETILLVEDESALLGLVQAMLANMGYTVLPAGSPTQAIEVAGAHKGVIDLLLTDVVMPEMSGLELWQHLVRERPHLKSLYMSGYTANIIAHHGVINDHLFFVQKPFSKSTLAAKVREALAS